MDYNDERYTNEKGLQNYEDNWAAAKVIAVIAFLIWFAFA